MSLMDENLAILFAFGKFHAQGILDFTLATFRLLTGLSEHLARWPQGELKLYGLFCRDPNHHRPVSPFKGSVLESYDALASNDLDPTPRCIIQSTPAAMGTSS